MEQQPPKVEKPVMADNAYLTGAFRMHDFIGGIVTVPAAWIAANLGFQVCDTVDGTYSILREPDSDQPVQIENMSTSAIRSYKIPNSVFPALYVKLWSKSATAGTETDVAQTGGPLEFVVMLK